MWFLQWSLPGWQWHCGWTTNTKPCPFFWASSHPISILHHWSCFLAGEEGSTFAAINSLGVVHLTSFLSLVLPVWMSHNWPILPDSLATLVSYGLWHFLRQRFWWPSMDRDVKHFIWACLVFAREKSSHQPLDNLWRPWSHIAVDFVTGPPPWVGNNAILTMVDCFSKAVHFVPLPKLPSSAKTGDLLVRHVFRLHSFPIDIASDQGPQFTSQVWSAFCAALEPLWVSHLGIICSPMVKRSGPIRVWRMPCFLQFVPTLGGVCQ